MENTSLSPEEWAAQLKAKDQLYGKNYGGDGEQQPYSLAGDLDKIDLDKSDREEEMKRASLHNKLGYIKIPYENLPTKGRFYPNDSELMIRSLTVQELRHWSTIDDSQPLDVNSHLNQILLSSSKLVDLNSGKNIGYQYICDADRLFILLMIRDLTFKEPESKIEIPIRCNCGANVETKVTLKHNSIVLHEELPEKIDKYYDAEQKCFIIKTNNGNYVLHLPRVGVMEKVYNKISELEQQKRAWDKSFYVTLPYLIINPKLVEDEKQLNKLYNEFILWDIKKFQIIDSMIRELKIGPTDKIKGSCSKSGCGAEVIGDLTFPDGIRSLFTVSNIDSELL